jgi:hypothetical protein
MGQGVRSQKQSVIGIAYKACFKGSVERSTELAQGQRRKDENVITGTQ